MADDELATRAPESDAQEQSTNQPSEAEKISGIPGDTKPDQGAASMGVCGLKTLHVQRPWELKLLCRSTA